MITNDTLKVIYSRKSVRKYIDKPVTKEQLETLVHAAMAAPSGSDKRPWAFIVVTERETLKALAEGLQYGKMLANAGAAIVVCGVPKNPSTGVVSDMWDQDCPAATQNILLACESMGLGGVWIAVKNRPTREEHVAKVLGIPDDIMPFCAISIGYPDGSERPKDKWDPSNVHWGKW